MFRGKVDRDILRALPKRWRQPMERLFAEVERMTNSVGWTGLNACDTAAGTMFSVDNDAGQVPQIIQVTNVVTNVDIHNQVVNTYELQVQVTVNAGIKLTGMIPQNKNEKQIVKISNHPSSQGPLIIPSQQYPSTSPPDIGSFGGGVPGYPSTSPIPQGYGNDGSSQGNTFQSPNDTSTYIQPGQWDFAEYDPTWIGAQTSASGGVAGGLSGGLGLSTGAWGLQSNRLNGAVGGWGIGYYFQGSIQGSPPVGFLGYNRVNPQAVTYIDVNKIDGGAVSTPLARTNLAFSIVYTTIAANISVGTQTVTPASMTNIAVGVLLAIDTGVNREVVVVTDITATTFTAKFAVAHTGPGIQVRQVTGTVSPGLQTVSPASMLNITLGSRLLIDVGANRESVLVTDLTDTTFTATFSLSHAAPCPIVGIAGQGTNQAIFLYQITPGSVITIYYAYNPLLFNTYGVLSRQDMGAFIRYRVSFIRGITQFVNLDPVVLYLTPRGTNPTVSGPNGLVSQSSSTGSYATVRKLVNQDIKPNDFANLAPGVPLWQYGFGTSPAAFGRNLGQQIQDNGIQIPSHGIYQLSCTVTGLYLAGLGALEDAYWYIELISVPFARASDAIVFNQNRANIIAANKALNPLNPAPLPAALVKPKEIWTDAKTYPETRMTIANTVLSANISAVIGTPIKLYKDDFVTIRLTNKDKIVPLTTFSGFIGLAMTFAIPDDRVVPPPR